MSEIDLMKCRVCGAQAIGWNINGPFCSDNAHFIIRQEAQDYVSGLCDWMQGRGPKPKQPDYSEKIIILIMSGCRDIVFRTERQNAMSVTNDNPDLVGIILWVPGSVIDRIAEQNKKEEVPSE